MREEEWLHWGTAMRNLLASFTDVIVYRTLFLPVVFQWQFIPKLRGLNTLISS